MNLYIYNFERFGFLCITVFACLQRLWFHVSIFLCCRTVRVWLKRDSGQYWPSIYHAMPCKYLGFLREPRFYPSDPSFPVYLFVFLSRVVKPFIQNSRHSHWVFHSQDSKHSNWKWICFYQNLTGEICPYTANWCKSLLVYIVGTSRQGNSGLNQW